MRVADVRVAALPDRDRPGRVLLLPDRRRLVDAGAFQMEVVLLGTVADRNVVRAGRELRDGISIRVTKRDDERVVRPDDGDELRVIGASDRRWKNQCCEQ